MKKLLHISSSWAYSLWVLLACGLLATLPAKAQDQDQTGAWEINLSKPYVESLTNITKNSFTATWSNVEPQRVEAGKIYNPVHFRFIVTREHTATEDDPYLVANPKVLTNKGEKKPFGEGRGMGQAHLDEALSQPGWLASSVSWVGSAIELNATQFSDYTRDVLDAGVAHVMSPVLNLANGDHSYSITFTAKVTAGSGDATLRVYGHNEELTYSKSLDNVKTFTVPNDGAEHTFTYEAKDGSWAHRIIIVLTSFSNVEFTRGFNVLQNLKAGETAYRSTSYGYFLYDVAKREAYTETVPYQEYFDKYSVTLEDLDPRVLDVEAAQKDGDRIGFRINYGMRSPSYGGKERFQKSMYSEPAYFDNKEVSGKYVYLGYVGYEAPNHNNVHPSGPSWAGYHGGAIKATKELLKNNIGDKVVGIRFATLAGKQPGQVNSKFVGYDPHLPMIFLADKLRISTDPEDSRGNLIMHKSADKFVDGWNSVFFDEPYTIKEDDEFFAGIYAYDPAEMGGIAVASIKTKVAEKESYYVGTNWDTQTFGEAKFQDNFEGWPLLIHLIVEPQNISDETANRAEVRSLSAPEMIFSDEALNVNLKLFNSGLKSIKSIEVELDVDGTKDVKTIEFKRYIDPSFAGEVTISNVAYDKTHGKKTISVKLLKVNGIAQKDQTATATAEVQIYERNATYERRALVETFTSENCTFCPAVTHAFEQLLLKPENADMAKRVSLVSHHSMNDSDYLCMKYSEDLLPFIGVKKERGGNVTFAGKFSPGLMINRMANPHLGDPRGTNGIIYSHIGDKQAKFDKALNYATKEAPAYVGLYLFPYFDADKQKLDVKLEGFVSTQYDKSRPLYVTIMITQDEVDQRNQQGAAAVAGFKHRNVLRIVDEAGFKGTQVTIDENNKFLYHKEMTIATMDAGAKPLRDNTLLLKPGQTLEDALKHVKVIAVVHNYEELPTLDNIEEDSNQMLFNEVQNTALRRVSFTKIDGVEEMMRDTFEVIVTGRNIDVVGDVDHFEVYNINGMLVPATDLISGGYIVKVTLTDGATQVVKVVIP